MKIAFRLFRSCVSGVPWLLSALAADPLTESLQQGLLEEEVNRDLNAAAKAYESAVKQTDAQRRAAATAVFRLGEVYRKLGRTNDAVAQYRRVLDQFADQAPLAGLSRTNLLRLQAEPDLIAAAAPLDEIALRRELLGVQRELAAANRSAAASRQGTPSSADPPEPSDRSELSAATGRRSAAPATNEEAAEIKRIQAIIKNSPDLVNARNATPSGGTPLHQAVASGYLVVAEFLLTNGADANAPDSGRQSPLHLAAAAGHKRVCELLLAKGADVNATDYKGFTPFHLAVANGYLAVAETLLAAGAEVNTRANPGGAASPQPDWESSPLHSAAEQSFPTLVELLLKHGAKINATDRAGRTPLVRAIQKSQPTTVRLLLEKGADPNLLDAEGSSALFWAVVGKQESLLQVLLDHQADVEVRLRAPDPEGDWTVLFRAVGDGEVALTQRLLDAGANPNAQAASGITPVHWAAIGNRPTTLKLLLERKPDVNARDSGDNTPLHHALEWGQEAAETVEALLAGGADSNAAGWNGAWPPLLRSVAPDPARWPAALIETLLNHGSDGSATLTNGWTALHRAVQFNRSDLVELLVAKKSNVNARGSMPQDEPTLGQRTAPTRAPAAAPGGVGRIPPRGPRTVQPGVPVPRPGPVPITAVQFGVRFGGETLPADKEVTPLHVAVAGQNLDLAKFLLDHGADVNACDGKGRAPLHFAVNRRDLDLIRLLLDAKADPDAKDTSGQTPLALAGAIPQDPSTGYFGAPTPNRNNVLMAKPQEILALLRERGAKPVLSDPNAITVSRSATDYSAKVLTRGSRDWNQFTLLELLAVRYGLLAQSGVQPYAGSSMAMAPAGGRPDDPLAFPDLARLRISRPLPNGGEQTIAVDLSAAVQGADCNADVPLEWGDVVEIPEEDHPLSQAWVMSDGLRATLKQCLERKVEIQVKGERNTYALQLPFRRAANGQGWEFDASRQRLGWDVRTTLDRSGLLRTSSDRSRVMVKRTDPVTGTLREWLVDCSSRPSEESGLWLRDGDVIEVPDKAETVPTPADAGVARILGEVKQPGTVALDPDRPKDILDAIAECGGLTEQARPQIEFTREGLTRRFTIDELKVETDPAKKLWLSPGDTLEVKKKVL